MNTNRWIADRGYGSGMAIGFEGDTDFIRRSINFAVNFLVHDASNIHQHTPTFVTLNTTQEKLEKALYDEAYAREMLRLTTENPGENPLSILRDDDYPEGFNESCEKFRADLHAAADHIEVAEVLKRDPTRMIFPSTNPQEFVEKAKVLAKKFVADTMAALEPEEFMRRMNGEGLSTYQVSEFA